MRSFLRARLDVIRGCFQRSSVSGPLTKYPEPISIAKAREDFIKRLFAVTLSVGVASQVVRIMFDPSHMSPQYDWPAVIHQWKTIVLLLVSLIIVVSSWEGYLGAIERMPLEDAGRFWVDIALVFSYLLLTLSSQIDSLWFSIHTLIFAEYLLWDYLRSNLPIYKARQKASPQQHYQLSMVITIVWLLYFVAILLLKDYVRYFDESVGFAAIAFAALAGVLLYRRDKKVRWCWLCKAVVGFIPLFVLGGLAYLKIK